MAIPREAFDRMAFSRHRILYVEAMLRIGNRAAQAGVKGRSPVRAGERGRNGLATQTKGGYSMRIGVIQAASQRDKNEILYRCACRAVQRNGRSDVVVNYGVYADEDADCSYVEAALVAGLLLSGGAVDFIVTGCASGQGMMLACNSLPDVLCGFVQTPQDAYLFGGINGGNAVSLPLGLNYAGRGRSTCNARWTSCLKASLAAAIRRRRRRGSGGTRSG